MQKSYISHINGSFLSYADALASSKSPIFAENRLNVDDKYYKALCRKAKSLAKNPPGENLSIRLLPYIAATGMCAGDVSILDVGGRSGRSYYGQVAVLGKNFCSRYDILEAPEFAQALRDNVMPRYFADVQCIAGAHYSYIVFGAMLQILEDPMAFFQDVVSKVSSDFILITTFPLFADLSEDKVALKRLSRNSSYPYWLFSPRWLSAFEQLGTVILTFDMPSYFIKVDGVIYPQKCFWG